MFLVASSLSRLFLFSFAFVPTVRAINQGKMFIQMIWPVFLHSLSFVFAKISWIWTLASTSTRNAAKRTSRSWAGTPRTPSWNAWRIASTTPRENAGPSTITDEKKIAPFSTTAGKLLIKPVILIFKKEYCLFLTNYTCFHKFIYSFIHSCISVFNKKKVSNKPIRTTETIFT